MTESTPSAPAQRQGAENPYVGPRTFETTDSDRRRFFGREREARELLAIVTAERLTLFYAQSGAGKSSLINARLIPALADKGFEVLPVGRVGSLDQAAPAGANPFVYNLMRHMVPLEQAAARFADLTLADFLGRLVYLDGGYRLVDAGVLPQGEGAEPAERQDAIDSAGGAGFDADGQIPVIVPRVLIVDQFEELFTAHPGAWDKQAALFEQLAAAMAADPYLWVLLSLREDYVAGLDPYAHLTLNGLSARYSMRRMEVAAALEAVKNPAAAGGRPFAEGVAEKLVDNLRTVRGQAASIPQLGQYVEPVQLQVVCYQLWEKLIARPPAPITAEDLDQAGDVDTALEHFYDEALAAVLKTAATPLPEWKVRDWLEKALITEANTRGTVFVGATETAKLPNAIVRGLAGRFLLRLEPRAGGTWCELMHDRFIQPLRQANRDWLGQQDPLLRAALAWESAQRAPARLYSGLQLKEALRHARELAADPLIAEFLATSQAHVEAMRLELWQDAPPEDSRATGFARSLALLIGIDDYGNGLPRLTTAAGDATQLAQLLREQHGYCTHLLTEEVTLEQLETLFVETLPKKVGPDDRLLLYFAGHGIAIDSEAGPRGYLAPQDANPESSATILSFDAVFQWLGRLPCRHLLAIFDCNFAGSFTWSGVQPLRTMPNKFYREHFEKFTQGSAWQLIHSTASPEEQMAYWAGGSIGQRRRQGEHSVFATALYAALSGSADLLPMDAADGLITASELYLYLRSQLEGQVASASPGALPAIGLWPLKPPGKGEYCFFTPGQQPQLAPAPPATADNNPYLGIKPFEETDQELFFGREVLVSELVQRVMHQPLTVVEGASGTGKSSLVKAGLIPALRAATRDAHWHIMSPIRPTDAPLRVLYNLFTAELTPAEPAAQDAGAAPEAVPAAEEVMGLAGAWLAANAQAHLLLVVDQLEELVTITQRNAEGVAVIAGLVALIQQYPARLHVVFTIRSDFKPHFSKSALAGMPAERWEDALFPVRQMTRAELRAAIVGPADRYAIEIEPPALTDTLIDEVISAPGALSMLSFTMSELYLMYVQRAELSQRQGGQTARALTGSDYQKLGGVSGSLERRAEEIYAQLGSDFDASYQATMQRVMLRMIAAQGNELARRRVPTAELVYPLAAENDRVAVIVDRLEREQLCLRGSDDAGVPFVEPAHDALVRAWGRLLAWKREADDYLPLQRRLNQAAVDWLRADKQPRYLWMDDPRLTQLRAVVFPTVQAEKASLVSLLRESLWPPTRPIDQPTWLNALETEFVGASVVRRARIFQRFAVIVSSGLLAIVCLILVAFGYYQFAARENLSAQALRAEATAMAGQVQAVAAQATAEAAREQSENARMEAEYQAQAAQQAQQEQKEAERDSAITQANVLASQALAGEAAQPVQSLLLAVEAVTKTWGLEDESGVIHVAAAEQALRNTLQRTGGTLLTEHTARVNAAAFSPDGRWLASGSDDATTRLWDMRNPGRSIVLAGHTAPVIRLAFSGDGRWLATVGADGVTYLWDQTAATQATQPLTITTASPSGAAIAFTPDGRFFVTMGFQSTRGGTQSAVYVKDLDAPSAPVTRTLDFDVKSNIQLAALAPDGTKLATASPDETIQIWDALDGALLNTLAAGDFAPWAMAFSQDGKWLATAGADGSMRVWETDAASQPVALQGLDRVSSAIFSPDAARLVTLRDTTVTVWDRASGNNLLRLEHPSTVQLATFRPDGRQLAVVGDDSTIHVWDMASGQETATLVGHSGPVNTAVFSPDPNSSRLATAGDDTVVRLWTPNLASREPVVRNGRADPNAPVVFSPDGRWLASPGKDTQLLLWQNANANANPRALEASESPLSDLAFSADSSFLAAASGETAVRLWPVQVLDAAPFAVEHPTNIDKIAFSPNNRWLAALGADRRVYLWDVETLPDANSPVFRPAAQLDASQTLSQPVNAELQPVSITLPSRGGFVSALIFSPDSNWLATLSSDSAPQLWRLDGLTRTAASLVLPEIGRVVGAAFAREGNQLITVGNDRMTRVWTLTSSDPVTATQSAACMFDGRVTGAALSRSDRWLAAATDNFAIELCDLGSGVPAPVTLAGHQDRILAIGFSPQEDWLVSASADGTVRLWDVSDPAGKSVVLGGQAGPVRQLAVSPEGRWLATVDDDGLVRQWRLQQDELVTLACSGATTNLTMDQWQLVYPGVPYRQTCPEWPIHPSVAPSHLMRGDRLARLGDRAGAITEFELAKQIDPALIFDSQARAEQVASQTQRVSPSEKLGIDAMLPIESKSDVIAPRVADPNVVADTGAGWVRLNFVPGSQWADPNDLHRPRGLTWQETYRKIIDGYRSRGLGVYGLLGAQIVPTEPGDQFRAAPPPDVGANDWIEQYVANYVAILRMFKDDLGVVESLNEPDDWGGGATSRFHPGWYAIIQQRLYDAVRSNPELAHIKLVSAPLQGFDINENAGAHYLASVYAAGKARYGWGQPGKPFPFDGVGYHLYVGEGAANPVREATSKYDAYLEQLGQVISAAEGQAKPIYLSEVGWASNAPGGEEAQARVLRSLLSRIAGDPAIELGVWFGLQDSFDRAYGLYRAGNLAAANRKPAYGAFQAVMSGDLVTAEPGDGGTAVVQPAGDQQGTATVGGRALDETFWQQAGVDRRLGAWFDPMNLTIVPIAQRPDQPEGDVVYVVKDIFTTRDGSWEPSAQFGSIDSWARPDYLRPFSAPDYFDDAGGDHHLFSAVIGLDGELIRDQSVRYWPDGIARLGEPKYQDYVIQQTKSSSGWANLPVFNNYSPDKSGAGDWCWTLEGPAEVVCGGGLPDGDHVSTFVVWQAVQR